LRERLKEIPKSVSQSGVMPLFIELIRDSFIKVKEDEDFNHPGTICWTYGAGRNTLKYFED